MKEGGAKCIICKIVALLAGIGALNWGLVALFNFNLVAQILGAGTLAKAVYVLVGLSGLLLLVSLVKCCPCCKTGGSCSSK
ncbi:MAG: DUF378 domain-containing protein [Candidatus Omnitrophica bacterium CG11_big_fil_rev_8_21_14_0_20_64_10]|nr:MAG: DUF378 domain-containing protein [Candidatus Omnitrophica bacterium CG11_big_fil_rev_8_21_14_0_20_64_10]